MKGCNLLIWGSSSSPKEEPRILKDMVRDSWNEYENYILKHENIDVNDLDKITKAMLEAVKVAYTEDKVFGKEIADKTRGYIDKLVFMQTGVNFPLFEKWAQTEKRNDLELLDRYYAVHLAGARDYLEDFMFYIEKNRPRRERFYEPRVNPLSKIAHKLQALEDDELDELFVHMPARVGKTQLITLFTVWHCARDTEKSNLYVTYKEGLGGAFLDGVKEIITDPTYCFGDVFPDVVLGDTDAKNNKMDLNRKKKYKTLSGKGLESGLNGEYDAYGIMILDDILEGVQDVMSPEVLKRKQTIFDNNVMSRQKESCKIIYNGTIWATNDLFMNRMNFLETDPSVKDVRWDVIKIPALDPNTDESNFDYKYGVGYSTKYYQARRAKFEMNDDLAGWWAQCQQEPIDRTGAVFNPEHMADTYAVLPEMEPLKVIAHCDVALGGDDYLCFPIVYCYENGEMYCEDVVFDNSEKHITQPKVISKVKKHDIKNIHFEMNQGGEGYKDDIKRLLEDEGYKKINITADWAPVNKRKEQRIWDEGESIRQIHFKDPQHRDKEYQRFMNNLFSFTMVHGKRKHDDAADALAGLIAFDRNGSGVATVQAIQNPFRR